MTNNQERNLTMIFDVETTGLIPTKKRPGDIPHILQLCFIIYDTERKETIQTFNSYVNVPELIEISEEITELTGITREKCNAGNSIEDVLISFYRAYETCTTIVAHNLKFDKDMMIIEMARNSFKLNELYEINSDTVFKENSKQLYCTMLSGVKTCNIMGKYQLKWPSLSELHNKLYGEIPNGLHDALVDTNACLKCYLKLIE
jgi:DNA polymerase III alpha subunit (gram-positive type)